MMKFKLKLLAAAVAFAVAGGAQAAVDFTSGDGSLFLNLTTPSNAAGNGSAAFDLGFTQNQALTWNGVSGLSLQWNLSTGAFTSNNAGVAASNATLGSYGSALTTFQGNTAYALGTAQMSVLAFDPTDMGILAGAAGGRITSTSNIIGNTGTGTQPGATFGPTNSQLFNTPASPNILGFQGGVNGDPGMAAANGFSTASFGDADFYNYQSGMSNLQNNWSGFDNTGLYGGQYAAGSTILAGEDKALPFFMFVSNGLSAATRAARTPFGYDLDSDGIIEFDNNGGTAGGSNEYGLWTLQGDVLTFSNPDLVAAVPEPGTYAMMLAGLAMLGGIARRRMS